MNWFLNYKNGKAWIDGRREVTATATFDLNDILDAYIEESEETLTASLEIWIKEEISKIDLSVCSSREDAYNYIFGEADFLEIKMNRIDIDITEYPDLRDFQHDAIDEASEKFGWNK